VPGKFNAYAPLIKLEAQKYFILLTSHLQVDPVIRSFVIHTYLIKKLPIIRSIWFNHNKQKLYLFYVDIFDILKYVKFCFGHHGQEAPFVQSPRVVISLLKA
jgi:hypothetical protein